MEASMDEASLESQKENTFIDTLINFYMNNPALYEKMEDEYVITIEKLDKLTILSDYLKELSIYKKVPDIIRAWQDLVKKFKQQLALENAAKSGSGVGVNNFPYFESLAFLRSAVKNRECLSSISLSSTHTAENGTSSSMFQTTSRSDESFSPAMTIPPKSHAAVTGACSSMDHSILSATSTPVRRPLKIPEYDGFAKKKLKSITEDDEQMKLIGQNLMKTLDNINKRVETAEQNEGLMKPKRMDPKESPTVDYRKLLSDAVEKIPAGYENELLEFVIEELDKFDQEHVTK